MSAKIHYFNGVTSLDTSTQHVLGHACEAGLESVIIIGRRPDGALYFNASYADGPNVLWDIEVAKRCLIDVEVQA